MSPKLTLFLSFLGVLAAGSPLLWLTRSPEPTVLTASAPAENTGKEAVYAVLRVTGNPTRVVLRLHGELLAEVTDACPWEGDLLLPSGMSVAEVEVESAWPAPGEQAVTLTLEPDGKEARSCTRWADAVTGTLHDVFNFVW